MNPLEIDIQQNSFSGVELESLGEAIMLVERLKKDKPLWTAIEAQMKTKVKPIESIADLRLKAQEVALQSEGE